MKILGIDSSDNYISIGIADSYPNPAIIISRSVQVNNKNKVMIHEFLSELLQELQLDIANIDAVAVASGPGSFTGLRIGMAAAKGICWSSNIKLTGVSSLRAISLNYKNLNKNIIVVKNAKRGEFYYSAFNFSGSDFSVTIADSVGIPSEIFKIIDEGYIPVGPGLCVLNSHIVEILKKFEDHFDPSAMGGNVAMLGYRNIINGKLMDISTGSPVYVREPRPGQAT